MAAGDRETEVKFHIRDLARLTKRVIAAGGRLVTPRTHELNLRFDTPAGDLSRAGRLLRLRQDERVRLTFKDGGKYENGIRSRREIELEADDFEKARRLLEALGYVVIFIYEKFRTTYAMGADEIALDELPYGDFLEIEGREAMLPKLADKLGLTWEAAVKPSYHMLFEHLQAGRSLPFQDLTFLTMRGLVVSAEDLGVVPADK